MENQDTIRIEVTSADEDLMFGSPDYQGLYSWFRDAFYARDKQVQASRDAIEELQDLVKDLNIELEDTIESLKDAHKTIDKLTHEILIS